MIKNRKCDERSGVGVRVRTLNGCSGAHRGLGHKMTMNKADFGEYIMKARLRERVSSEDHQVLGRELLQVKLRVFIGLCLHNEMIRTPSYESRAFCCKL